MKELLKKAMLALFGIALALGVAATPALAAEPTTNVKISNIVHTADKGGDVATAYRLVKYTDGGNGYEFVDSNFEAYIKNQGSYDTSKTPITYLRDLGNSGVATLMTSYMRNWSATPDAYGSPATAVSGNTATLQSLEPGYYLILVESKNGSSYSPMVVFVRYDGANTAKAYGTADGTIDGETSELGSDGIEAKRSDAITIEKKVLRNNGTGWHDTKTVQAGDEVTFRVAVTYPNYNDENVDPHATLHDELTNLKVASAADIALYSDAELSTKIEDGLKDVAIGDYADNDTQAISAMINWDNVPKAENGGTVYIGYKATVMQRAATSGAANNSAYVEYLTSAANDQSSYTKTSSSETNLYSFAFDLQKVKADGSAITGAQFKVYAKDSKDSGDGTLVHFTELADGSGYVLTQSGTGVDTVSAKFGANGNELKLYGLDPFQYYYFEEATTPAGYAAPTGKFKLDLSSRMNTATNAENASGEHTGELNAAWKTTDAGYSLETVKDNQDVTHSKFYAVSGNDDALVSIDSETASGKTLTVVLKNATTAALPTTGGMGTVVFTVVGVVLMAGAAGFVIVRRKRD